MTHALVVYESMFGNAQAVAHAIAEGLGRRMDVELVEVGCAPLVIGDEVALLVVGGPTHMLTLTRPSSRARAARKVMAPLVSGTIGLREWLSRVQVHSALLAASFDSRLVRPGWLLWFDSAAPKIGKRLSALGLRLLLPPQSFFVAGERGPLLPDELQRARDWGEALGLQYSPDQSRIQSEASAERSPAAATHS